MSQVATTRTLPPVIASRIGRLRFYVRSYVWAQGLALSVVSLGVAFWATLLLDWLFEPGPKVRIGVLVAVALLVGFVLIRQLILRLLVPLNDRSMALLLERRHRQLEDRLLTVVELSRRSPETAGYDPVMLSNTGAEAATLMEAVRPANVFNFRPLLRSLALALLVAASVAAMAAGRPTEFHTWVDRSLLLSPRHWPRDTLILVDGFPADKNGRRTMKVVSGGDLEVRARADTSHRIPDALEVDYAAQDGTSLRQSMTRQGTAVPSRDRYQNFVFKFKNIQSSLEFDVLARHAGVLGKDDRVDGLWVEVVESPTLPRITLRCTYPPYLKRTPASLPVTGIMSVPEGTEIVVEAESSKELLSVECLLSRGESNTTAKRVEVPDHGRKFELPLGPLNRDTILLFTLHDTDEVSNRQPLPLHIRAVSDDVPQMDVRLAGIGKAITPKALMPLRGRISDDHGVSRAWFEYRVQEEKDPHEQPFSLPKDGQLTADSGIALDALGMNLKPGGRLYLWIKAADAYPLGKGPHVGTTSRYELEVVTESQLRALMETTELLLRRRLEGVIADLNRTRDSLTRLKSESDDPHSAAEHAQTRGAIRVEDALQSTQRNAHETQDIAEQFERILLELQNNRVDHFDQLRSRLGDSIAAPLKSTVTDEFPRLTARLNELRGELGDKTKRLAAANSAQQEVDVILRQMDKVIGKMLELESYNELLAQLRSIIQSHEKVTQLTRQRRDELKKELRKGLLE